MDKLRMGTFLDRVKQDTEKWGRQAGRVDIQYEDIRCLIACAEALRKHEPAHKALRYLDSQGAILE